MKKLISKRKLGRETSHRLALLRYFIKINRNQTTSLILHERIKTTVPKAKELRVYADKVITLSKKGDLNAIREVNKIVYTKEASIKLFNELAPRYKNRPGGYTRILRCGYRRSDKAPMCFIEYVDREGELRACKHSYVTEIPHSSVSTEVESDTIE